MLMRLDPAWLMMAIAIVSVMSFFFGAMMDAIMKEDGFGPIGNMVLIAAGFFIGILVANYSGFRMSNLAMATATGLCGSFVTLALLALLKAGAARF